MSREAILMVVGILVALAPFSGLPHSWQVFILPFLGIVAGGIGYMMRGEQVRVARTAPSAPEYAPQHAPSRVA